MKIPIIFLAYYNTEIIKTALNKLLTGKFDIYVVENRSPYSVEIGEYLQSLLRLNQIKSHIKFEKNISNNAVQAVFDDGLIDLRGEFIIITDGDLIPDDDWLSEHLEILTNNQNVFVVSQSLDMINLPLATFPSASNWIPPDIKDHGDFIEARTGTHLMTFRKGEFRQWLAYRAHNNLKFCDENIHTFGYQLLCKKSARTKKTKSLHLTWNIYKDTNHSYTKERLSTPNTWDHNNFCAYKVYTR